MNHRRGTLLGQTYYWIVARYEGRLVIIGPKMSEEEANSWSYAHLDVPFDVMELNTRSRAHATSMVKAKHLDTTSDLGSSLQKSMSRPPQSYQKKWWGNSAQ